MKKELQVMEGVINTGEVIVKNGYKNVLLSNKIAVASVGLVDVRVLISEEMEETESKELLSGLSEEIEGLGFVAWLPLNSTQGCCTSNNFGLDMELSEIFCSTLISLYGLEDLCEEILDNEQLEAA